MKVHPPAPHPLVHRSGSLATGSSFHGMSSLNESSLFDARVSAWIEKIADTLARTACSRDDREDYVQEALVHFWQVRRKSPCQTLLRSLTECRWFIRDKLKLGRSVDSPKRRRLGQSLDLEETYLVFETVPQLITTIDPSQNASADDAFEQVSLRLKKRERIVLRLLCDGNGTRDVARQLGISPAVVTRASRHIRRVALQLGFGP